MSIKLLNIFGNYTEYLDSKLGGGVSDNQLTLVSDPNYKCLCTMENEFQFIPSNGEEGSVLLSQGGKGVWSSFNYLDLVSYGVEWDINVADPDCTRIGNMEFHKTLPIQSGMKGCIYDAISKEVVYWLDEDNWDYKKGGNPDKGEKEDPSRLDGYDGEVMVYVPEFYIKSWEEGTKRSVRISTVKVDDTWEHQPEVFIAPWLSTLIERDIEGDMGYLSRYPINTAVTIQSSESYCIGGNGTDSSDVSVYSSNRNKPRTNLPTTKYREYAKKGEKSIMTYNQYKNILCWLPTIEYATFNIQKPYNPELTSEGFHQGGLGAGVTNFSSYITWSSFNNGFGIIPNGQLNRHGNNTAVEKCVVTLNSEYNLTIELSVPRWRGIENPFGHLCQTIDNVQTVETMTDDGISNAYLQVLKPGTTEVERQIPMALNEGHIKALSLGTHADIIPSEVNAPSNTTYMSSSMIGECTNLGNMFVGERCDSKYGAGLFSIRRVHYSGNTYQGYRLTSAPN